ncbi:hypothetical protein GGI19_001129 [Coemansia pectinata]|uniref:Uncharacterized protein n=1 Tax=Coemansia pectinata TaxID=1052879 RepID=A0A9W8GY89_9FUNG|nr:hypothetical protein GGI19_001129 [Coemansia pectinata]
MVDDSVYIKRRPLPQINVYSGRYNPHLVRELNIKLDIDSIVTGDTLRQLSRASYNEGIFPLVRTIHFEIFMLEPPEDEYVGYPDDTRAHANIVDFVQHIRRMAPATNKIWTLIKYGQGGLTRHLKNHSGDLMTQLYQIGSQVQHSSSEPSVFNMDQVASVRNLVHLDYYTEKNCEHLAQLVRQNAPSLQYLRIVICEPLDIAELIRDESGAYVEYPCLHTMEHQVMADLPDLLPAFEGAAPFPSLRRLVFRTEYSYGDDTLFRGNAATLESLRLRVETKFMIDDMQGRSDIARALVQFVLGIAPHASMREVEGHNYSDETFPLELSHFSDHISIQVLSLPRTPVQLWDVVSLIGSLPLLSDLHTQLPTLGDMPTGTSSATLPAYVRSKYAPMGKRFRCWRLDCELLCVTEESAQCVLLLALICPNFGCAALLDSERGKFMDMLEATTYSDEFIQYGPRLQGLIFRH